MSSYYQIHEYRKNFLIENANNDHVFLEGKNSVVLSAPHGVSQVRLGKYKCSEIGSLATALYLKSNTNCNLIAKTKNNFDDANFDENCEYRKHLEKIVKLKNIKYVIDIHGLAEKRNWDVNLGTHLGKNISNDQALFSLLYQRLINAAFNVTIDQPFMGAIHTISGSLKKKYPEIWTLQIEINCGITNKKVNFDKYEKLLKVLENWLNSIENFDIK